MRRVFGGGDCGSKGSKERTKDPTGLLCRDSKLRGLGNHGGEGAAACVPVPGMR